MQEQMRELGRINMTHHFEYLLSITAGTEGDTVKIHITWVQGAMN